MEHLIPRSNDNDVLTQVLDRSVMTHQLEKISIMDRNGLLAMLPPHENLPDFDPTSHAIRKYKEFISDNPLVSSKGYELGAIFAKLIIHDAYIQHDRPVPTVNKFQPDKITLVDQYLDQSFRRNVAKLETHDKYIHPDLQKVITLFCQRCLVLMPDELLDGTDAIRHGFHDYISIIELLEAPTQDEAIILRRQLGKAVALIGLGGLIMGNMYKWRHKKV